MYFRSSFATAFIPYIGLPIYLLWIIFFHLAERDGTYSFLYASSKFTFLVVYLFIMRFYSSNILTSLNNYALELIAEDLARTLSEREEQSEDETDAFETGNSEDGEDAVLDEWIFI